ncbi:MAG: LptF/LptG family permease [Bacteroidales bacterium]|nr:LptF/LptG family permease [Bacteroidales bacterium]
MSHRFPENVQHPLKRLDRYILGKYLKTFLLALALIIIIVITFDVSEKLDKFLEHHATLWQVISIYYLNFIPGFVNLYSPLFIFISVIFFTSKMAGNSEIIAILSSGVRYGRMLRPYVYGAAIVAVVVFVLGNFVIPSSNQRLIAFEEEYVKSKATNYYSNLHFQAEPGVQVYAESYDVQRLQAFKFCREELDANGRLLRRETANSITYDTSTNLWHCTAYSLRSIDSLRRETLTLERSIDIDFNIEPEDLNLLSTRVETMNTPDLIHYIHREQMRGTGTVKAAQIELWQRLINPLAIIVMTLIGVAIAARKRRGGIGVHLAIGISIAFAFIVFMKITTVFATNGDLSPFMAVLLPQIIFSIAAAWLIYKAPK